MRLHRLFWVPVISVALIATGAASIAFSATNGTVASPTNGRLFINSKEIDTIGYSIGNNVYYQLRQLAKSINYNVNFDKTTKVVQLDNTHPNTDDAAGIANTGNQVAFHVTSAFTVNSKFVSIKAYTINGYNFVNLSDFAAATNISLKYDSAMDAYYLDDGTEFNATASNIALVSDSPLWTELSFEQAEEQCNLKQNYGVIIYYDRNNANCHKLIPMYQEEAEKAGVKVYAVDRGSSVNMGSSHTFFGYNYTDSGLIELPTIYITLETKINIYADIKTRERTAELFTLVAGQQTKKPPVQGVSKVNVSFAKVSTNSQYTSRVIDLVNYERANRGLGTLVMDNRLMEAAQYKCEDMLENSYYSHPSPTFGEAFKLMHVFSILYKVWGENIAAGQLTPDEVMVAWMNSPEHRDNILKAEFTRIGVGYLKGGEYGTLWAQEMIND
jgi:uncharacterized YkwD family protein